MDTDIGTHLGVKVKVIDRNIGGPSIGIKVLTSPSCTDVARIVTLETRDVVMRIRPGQIWVLAVSFLEMSREEMKLEWKQKQVARNNNPSAKSPSLEPVKKLISKGICNP